MNQLTKWLYGSRVADINGKRVFLVPKGKKTILRWALASSWVLLLMFRDALLSLMVSLAQGVLAGKWYIVDPLLWGCFALLIFLPYVVLVEARIEDGSIVLENTYGIRTRIRPSQVTMKTGRVFAAFGVSAFFLMRRFYLPMGFALLHEEKVIRYLLEQKKE